ncbi:MAG: adenylyltransferase/cytidyltransferase family protein [Patescibacteria group bacterium]|jgi:cytidyltransferase-like protein
MKNKILKAKETKVMAFGTFDIFHKGHESYLKQAAKHGSHLIVVIGRDKNVKIIKGKLPKNSENDRLKRVRESGLAQTVILGNLRDKYAVIRKYKPDIIALGYDQRSFVEGLAKKFKKIKIVRLKSFKPSIYKSSKIGNR